MIQSAFSTMFALVLAVTLVIVPSFAPYNQVLLLPAVFLIAASWKELWGRNRLTRMACGLAVLVVFWPWLASLRVDAGFLLLACEFGAKGLGRAALYQSGYSSRGFGIVRGMRWRSIENPHPVILSGLAHSLANCGRSRRTPSFSRSLQRGTGCDSADVKPESFDCGQLRDAAATPLRMTCTTCAAFPFCQPVPALHWACDHRLVFSHAAARMTFRRTT